MATIAQTPEQLQSPRINSRDEMVFSMDAGQIALKLHASSCVVFGVEDDAQAVQLSNDMAIVSPAYGLEAVSVNLDDGLVSDETVAKIDTFARDFREDEDSVARRRAENIANGEKAKPVNGLLVINGINRVINGDQKADPNAKNIIHRIRTIMKDPLAPAVCAVTIGLERPPALPPNFWTLFNAQHDFKGQIQPSDAMNILKEHMSESAARHMIDRFWKEERLTYATLGSITEFLEKNF